MKIHHFNGIYQEGWGFSWAMLVYQRVYGYVWGGGFCLTSAVSTVLR